MNLFKKCVKRTIEIVSIRRTEKVQKALNPPLKKINEINNISSPGTNAINKNKYIFLGFVFFPFERSSNSKYAIIKPVPIIKNIIKKIIKIDVNMAFSTNGNANKIKTNPIKKKIIANNDIDFLRIISVPNM